MLHPAIEKAAERQNMEVKTMEMPMADEYEVECTWDDEAKVWFATSKNLVGLVMESDSLDILIDRVIMAAPELIELNNLPRHRSISFSLNRHARVAFA